MENSGGIDPATIDFQDELVHLKKFIQACDEQGLLQRPQTLQEDDTTHGFNDETTLLRFLRGCAYNIDKAVGQLQEANAIRNSVVANEAYNIMDIDEFEDARGMFPHWTGHRDNFGRPICLFDLAHLGPDVITRYDNSRNKASKKGSDTATDSTRKMVVVHDYLTRFVLPLCSKARDRPDPEVPITSAIYLVDVSQFSVKQGWTLRNYIQDVSGMLSTCYPEVLHRVYMVNAPSYFGMFWNVLKKWLEPRTAAKLEFISQAEAMNTIFKSINAESIPIQLGGKSEYKHGSVAQMDVGLKKFLGEGMDILPKGPIKWVLNEAGEETLVAVGTSGEKVRQEVLCTPSAE